MILSFGVALKPLCRSLQLLNSLFFFGRQSALLAMQKNIIEYVFCLGFQVYAVTEERKEDQATVDRQILDVIRKQKEKKLLFGYLGSMFSLSNSQFPHKMVF